MLTPLSLLLSVLLAAGLSSALATIPIPLTFSSDKRYVVGIKMASSTFGMFLSTSTGDVVVAGANCPTCGGAPGFDISTSSSAAPIPSGGVRNATVLGSAVSGNLITETCSLVQRNGGLWTYPNQTLIVANSSTIPFSPQGSGIFGLGTTSHSGLLDNTFFGTWFSQHPQAHNFTYGMALKPPTDSGSAGTLHWLAADQSAFTGTVSWVPTRPPADDATSSSMAINITEWVLSTTGISNSNSRGAIGVIDPFHPEIRVPQAAARDFFRQVPGAIPQLGPEVEDWLLDCSSSLGFTIQLGDKKMSLDQKMLVKRGSGTKCYSALVGWADPTVNTLLLGGTFISSSYLVLSMSRTGTHNIGFADLRSESGLSPGAIGGIAAASIVAVILAVVLGWVLIKRKLERRSIQIDDDQPPYAVPTSANSRRPWSWSTRNNDFPGPSPSLTHNPSTVSRPWTVSVEPPAGSFAINPRPLSSGAGVLSPITESDMFTVEPFDVAPPPYLAPQAGKAGVRDIKARPARPPSSSVDDSPSSEDTHAL